MSHKLISLSPDLAKLRSEGFDIQAKSACLLVRDVPYVTSTKEVARGILVCKLMLAGDVTTKPDDHVAYFIGDHPCDSNGNKLEAIAHATQAFHLGEGVEAQHKFSAKPLPTGFYPDYYAKVTAYVDRISDPAAVLQPGVTAKTFNVVESDEDSVFHYEDTASTRAEITAVMRKLRLNKIAIIGLGGTGSYVLDLVAKTPVTEIHLYDEDTFFQHNAFRAPGAPSLQELRAKPSKVEYLKGIYAKMHKGIIAHSKHITAANVDELRDMQFVFICMDKGSTKRIIVEKLESFGTSFIDVGMGVVVTHETVGGIVSVTTSTAQHRDHVRNSNRISFTDGDAQAEYNTNVQIADLNALNAIMAVIKWKTLCGFYHDYAHELHSSYLVGSNKILNEDACESA